MILFWTIFGAVLFAIIIIPLMLLMIVIVYRSIVGILSVVAKLGDSFSTLNLLNWRMASKLKHKEIK